MEFFFFCPPLPRAKGGGLGSATKARTGQGESSARGGRGQGKVAKVATFVGSETARSTHHHDLRERELPHGPGVLCQNVLEIAAERKQHL